MKLTNLIPVEQIISESMDLQHFVYKLEKPEKLHDQLRMVNRGIHNISHGGVKAAFAMLWALISKIVLKQEIKQKHEGT